MIDPAQAATLALDALRRSALIEAERLSHEAFRAAPRHPVVLIAYGAVMNARGSYREAIKAFRRLTEIQPQLAAHWMNLASALRSTGERQQALEAYRKADRLGERSADFLFSFALLEMELGAIEAAKAHLRTAAELRPEDVEIRFQYTRACYACVDTDGLQESLRDWRRWQGWTPELMAGTASMLLQAGEQADAELILGRLDAMPVRNPEIELSIIGMLERVNRVDEAARRFAQVPPPAPSDPLHARWTTVRAQLETRAANWNLAEQLYRSLLELCAVTHERQQILFPLAKVLDAKADYAAAIGVIAEAHQSQTEALHHTGIEVEEDRPIMIITEYSCEPADVAQWAETAPPAVADSPIFIVAFPRSGTTLLEHMLDAHPQLQSMDEQPFLQKAVLRFAEHGVDYPSALKHVDADTLADIRRYYWELVATKLKLKPGQRLLDKNPLNMLRLPAIHRLFPNAPVLLAIRHPCDVIISNYFQHYRAPEFVRLCRDLPTLALAYRKAFDFWYAQAEILRPKAMEVRYETFVSEFESYSKRIAEFVSLDWHGDMLAPAAHARSKGFISTPSYSQVIQPVNTRAVGRWRRYQASLSPVLETLRPYLQRWHYEV